VTTPAAPRRVLLATTNAHKAREIAAILAPYGLEVDAPPSLPPVVEDGTTFRQNARKKAVAAARATGRAALADDSGLVVKALGGAPGVRSARYAGEHATDEQNVAHLLREVAAAGLSDPKAEFVCHAVLASPEGEVLAEAEAHVEGVVRGPPAGRHGFGYDPVFHWFGDVTRPGGVRFAELPPADKDAVSHRGRAFRSIARAIADLPPDAFDRAPGGR
jgi:XTP/dITP diphosphohydrolase